MNTLTARRLDALLLPLARSLLAGTPRLATAPILPEALPVLQAPLERPLIAIKLVGLGSLALLAPALATFAEGSGRPTRLLTVAANRGLLELLDWHVTPDYLRSGSLPALGWDVLRQWRRLRAARPAAVVDLEFHSAFTTLLGHALQPQRHVLLDAPWRRGVATDAVLHPAELHFADLAQRLFAALAGQSRAPGARLRFRAGALPPPTPRPPGRPRIVVNINAGIMCLERRLPLARFGDLMQALATAVGAEFELIGDRREQAYTSRFAAALPPQVVARNRAGQLGLAGLLGLLRDADLVISNDTGPMHLAAALGTPVLAVFGPESPARFGPRGVRTTAIWGRIACGPCLTAENRKTAPCRGDNRCLQQFTVDDLLPAALALLRGGGGGVVEVGPRLEPPVPG